MGISESTSMQRREAHLSISRARASLVAAETIMQAIKKIEANNQLGAIVVVTSKDLPELDLALAGGSWPGGVAFDNETLFTNELQKWAHPNGYAANVTTSGQIHADGSGYRFFEK